MRALQCARRVGCRIFGSTQRNQYINQSIFSHVFWLRGGPGRHHPGVCPEEAHVASFCSCCKVHQRLHSTRCHSASSSAGNIEAEGVSVVETQVCLPAQCLQPSLISLPQYPIQHQSIHSRLQKITIFSWSSSTAGCGLQRSCWR